MIFDFFTRPSPVQPYFYPPKTAFTRPNDWWTGLCIKLYNTVMWCIHNDMVTSPFNSTSHVPRVLFFTKTLV